MALVTVQRSPSPGASAETDEVDNGQDTVDGNLKSPRNRRRKSRSALKKLKKLFNTVRFVTKLKPCFSENYFTVKGAALILPQSDYETVFTRKVTKSHGGDIQSHLQSMFSLLRPLDTIKVAVKLEGAYDRYLALVSCLGKQDTEESVILGMDLRDGATAIGLIMPVWAHTDIKLDGDGGFSITSNKETHFFKPVSVQAMWSALQSLNKEVKIANDKLYIPGGLTHTWVGFYEVKKSKDYQIISEWNATDDIDVSYRANSNKTDDSDEGSIYKRIKTELKLVMMSVDLEEVTCKFLRESLEKTLDMNLREYRSFIDMEMFEILGQMDAPSSILDYLYLGSEWNASNIEELQKNGVHYILNVSKEIDNFYPGILHYMNVREWDTETAELMRHWEDTHKFISKARKKDGKVLVHCKMGISRSASTVIAYLMKENRWSRDEAYEFTKKKRSIINPNSGFWKQLETYEGILNARRNYIENVNKPTSGGQAQLEESEEIISMETGYPTTAEEMLDFKLGKDSDDRYMFSTEPDIELSSRSADSTEESLPDERSPQPADESVEGATGDAFLYPRKKEKPSSGDYLETDSSDETDTEEISDSDEHDKGGFRPIDVPKIDIQGGGKGKVRRKHDIKRVEPRRSKSESDKHCLTVEHKVSGISREGSVSKFRPDESWIKLVMSDEEEQKVEEPNDTNQGQEMTLEGTGVKQEEDEGLWMGEIKSSSVVEGKNSKEGVALSSGLVQKQIQGYQGKQTTSQHAKAASLGATDLQILFQSDSVKKGSETACASADQSIKVDTQNMSSNADTKICDTLIKTDSEMEVDQSGDAKSDISEASSSQKTKMRSRLSVYDLEEIDLPEDYVRKTKQQIEDRLSVETPKRKLQRSSSLKSKRVTPKAKDRDNERRKTCIAMLSPTTSDNSMRDELKLEEGGAAVGESCSEQKDGEDFSVKSSATAVGTGEEKIDETGTVKVYKYMGEELTVQEGLVKKQTLDIEQKSTGSPIKRPVSRPNSEMEFSGAVSDTSSACSLSSFDVSNRLKDTDLSSVKSFSCSGASKEVITCSSDKNTKSSSKDLGLVQDTKSFKTVESDRTTQEKRPTGKIDPISVSPDAIGLSESKAQTKDSNTPKEKDGRTAGGTVSTKKFDCIKANFQDKGEKMDMDSAAVSATPVASRKYVSNRQKSRFDEETLELIREIGSALINSPAKTEVEEETDAPLEGGSLVRHYVKNIEGTRKKKAAREIIIVDKDSVQDIAKSSSLQQSVASIPTQSCDIKSEITNVSNPKWSPVSKTPPASYSPVFKKPPSPGSITSSPESVKGSPTAKHETVQKPDPSILSLNLQLDKADKDPESETKSVKNLVGKFETPSGKTTPVSMVFGCIGSPGAPHSSLAGANTDIVIDKKEKDGVIASGRIAETDKTGFDVTGDHFSPKPEATKLFHDTPGIQSGSPIVKHRSLSDIPPCSAFTRPVQSPPENRKTRHRRSDPDIHLSERNIQLLDAKLRESGVGLIPSACIIESEEEGVDSEQNTSVPAFIVRTRSEDQDKTARERRSRLSGAKSKAANLGRTETASESDSVEMPMFSLEGRKVRKNYGKSHPLAKLEGNYQGSIRSTPFYSTM